LSKKITTPEGWTKFTGWVDFRDPIPLDAVLAYEEALNRARPRLCWEAMELRKVETDEGRQEFVKHFIDCCGKTDLPHCTPGMGETAAQKEMLPAVMACVEAWNIEGITNPTAKTFPGTPKKAASQFLAWLIENIAAIYVGEELDKADPNG